MDLYVCGQELKGASFGHPCAKAGKALEEAGYSFELKVVGGYRILPFSRQGKRDEVIKLSGQQGVPILVLDSGDVVVGSGEIVAWAERNAQAQ